ncbi:olfactory receptor 52K1-like [Ambystoma mexicanum]|uniref:olfactory receptor 52K1-like n=1 Tax=Ambystoma mexicanum TaxID=8296 RepID=UPI0037E7F887
MAENVVTLPGTVEQAALPGQLGGLGELARLGVWTTAPGQPSGLEVVAAVPGLEVVAAFPGQLVGPEVMAAVPGQRPGPVEQAEAPYRNDALVMSPVNNTEFTLLSFILTGIPGLEAYHSWFEPPLCFIYIVTLLGNSALILAIKTMPSLHRPMYLFISQLALCDLAVSSCIAPKVLSIFWFKSGKINFSACLIQMFCVTAVTALESAILSAMAFDRYVAICNPLRYSAIMTNSLIAKIAMASVTRAIVLCAPLQFITMRLPFCGSYVSHTYCENMAVSSLSCSDPTANSMYGLAASTLIGVMDILCIALSYILILKTALHFQHTKDSLKAIRSCSSHICILAAGYIPFFFSVVVSRLRKSVPIYVHVIVVNLYLILPPLLNPIIYGITMKEMVEDRVSERKTMMNRITWTA